MGKKFGLVGKSLKHSFSKTFFEKIFYDRGWDQYDYQLYELSDLKDIRKQFQTFGLTGFNITIPYKETIKQFCDIIAPTAEMVGAVNCVEIQENVWIGHNTDWSGFKDSLDLSKIDFNKSAIICGTGGAAKAIKYALDTLNLRSEVISRSGPLTYSDLTPSLIDRSKLIIQTTPLGTYPHIQESIPFPFEYLNDSHYCYDLIYNPTMTLFLEMCNLQGANTQNGYQMLVNQAIESFRIWTGIEL